MDGHITRDVYQARRREVLERLDALVIPEFDASLVAGAMLEDMGNIWQAADTDLKRRLVGSMLEAVYIDAERKSIVGLIPRPSFKELFLCLDSDGPVKIYEPATLPDGVADKTRQSFGGCGGDGGGLNYTLHSESTYSWRREIHC